MNAPCSLRCDPTKRPENRPDCNTSHGASRREAQAPCRALRQLAVHRLVTFHSTACRSAVEVGVRKGGTGAESPGNDEDTWEDRRCPLKTKYSVLDLVFYNELTSLGLSVPHVVRPGSHEPSSTAGRSDSGCTESMGGIHVELRIELPSDVTRFHQGAADHRHGSCFTLLVAAETEPPVGERRPCGLSQYGLERIVPYEFGNTY